LTFHGNEAIIVYTIVVETTMKLEDELKMQFKSPFDKAVLNIIFTGAWLSENFNQFLKPFGVSSPQFNVLRILRGQKGNPIPLYSIRERMVHHSSNATRLVDKLLLKGLVQREQNESNRRKIELTITQKGLKLLDEIEENHRGYRQKLHDMLNKNEAESLSDILDKIRA